jgi:hypothetical protein
MAKRKQDEARPEPGAVRLTAIGPFSAPAGATNRTRTIPVPWIDCETCSWRHFPSTSNGRWHIATTCANCGGELTIPVVPSGS